MENQRSKIKNVTQSLKLDLLQDPAIPVLGMQLNEMRSAFQGGTYVLINLLQLC